MPSLGTLKYMQNGSHLYDGYMFILYERQILMLMSLLISYFCLQ